MRIAHTLVYHIQSLYEFIYKQASQIWCNKLPVYGQQLATDPFFVSPVMMALLFLPPSKEPTLHSVSSSTCHVAAFIRYLDI